MAQDLRDLADEDLMQLVRRGQAPAFEVVYERHASAAFSLAYRIVGTRNGAEDVSQEAFLNLWRSGARYDRARGSVRTWVLGIVHHRAIDYLRRATVHDKRRASDEGMEERFEASERTDVEVARRDEAETVRSAIGTLPSEQSQVIELAYFGGFTHTEIAEMLETPVGTIKGRMRLGLKKMRDQLAGGAVTPLMQSAGPGHEHWEDATAAYLLGALDDDRARGLRGAPRGLPGLPRGGRRAAARRAGAADLRRSRRTARRAEGADHGRRRARGLAARRRRPRGRPAAGARAPPPAPPALAARPAARARGGRRRAAARRRRHRHRRDAAAAPAPTARSRPQIRRHSRGAERANAELEINGDEARLVARGLPAPPSGRVYQVWLKRDGHAPEPTAALFMPSRDGTATASVPGSLDGVDQVMVTDEPDGGSPQPTGDLLLVANLS